MKIKTWPEGLDVRGLGDNWEMLGVRKQLMTKKRKGGENGRNNRNSTGGVGVIEMVKTALNVWR